MTHLNDSSCLNLGHACPGAGILAVGLVHQDLEHEMVVHIELAVLLIADLHNPSAFSLCLFAPWQVAQQEERSFITWKPGRMLSGESSKSYVVIGRLSNISRTR